MDIQDENIRIFYFDREENFRRSWEVKHSSNDNREEVISSISSWRVSTTGVRRGPVLFLSKVEVV